MIKEEVLAADDHLGDARALAMVVPWYRGPSLVATPPQGWSGDLGTSVWRVRDSERKLRASTSAPATPMGVASLLSTSLWY